jgi:carbon monoxide dehydrogenase subunit G
VNLSAHYTIGRPPAQVYAALTDPAVLRRCIPGCEALTSTGEARYDATIKIGVAGLTGTYVGRAELRDPQPPHSFTLVVDGKARGPGFVRATAKIALSATDDQTRVACDADVQVGGLLAAVGSRLIEAVSRQQMDEFFRRLAGEFTEQRS